LAYLQRVYPSGPPVPADAPVWVSFAPGRVGTALTPRGVAYICAQRLGTAKVHALRHSFAHLMVQSGATVTDIQRKLGHRSLQTTTVYLEALASAENPYAAALLATLGVT
ncbi:MAG: tyrosine-type recombinase/integrase, partial [Chloroflexaceae bacterium]|nr:tyrosine-type recombinase/integrase [Chloroflexaceae bacterium]